MKRLQIIVSTAILVASGALFAAKGEFGDLCVTGLSMGKEVKTDCSVAEQMDGKTYCFSAAEAKAMFDKDPNAMLAKAKGNFDTLKK